MYTHPHFLDLYSAALRENSNEIFRALIDVTHDINDHAQRNARHPARITPYIKGLEKTINTIDKTCNKDVWKSPHIQEQINLIDQAIKQLQSTVNNKRTTLH